MKKFLEGFAEGIIDFIQIAVVAVIVAFAVIVTAM